MLSRNRGEIKKLDIEQTAKVHHKFGKYIKEQAERAGFDTLITTPEDTLSERAIKLLNS